MTVTPELLRSENFAEVGQILQQDAALLVERWSAQAVKEQPNAQRLHHQSLLNELPRLLTELGRSLAEASERNSGYCRPAIQHGEQRWEAGWSLGEVVRDYQLLRVVLVQYLEEKLARSLSSHELMAIGLCLDDAIAASVDAFVRNRDEYLRGLEQQRAEQDQRIKEELQHREEVLRQADRHKNEFLATLSHELRNPLAPLRNIVGVLELHETNDPVILQIREIIQRQVQQMVRLVDDLTDVSRIAQGKIDLRKERVSLSAVLEQVLQMAEPILAAHQHKLHATLVKEPLWMEGDPARLAQVFLNLLNNSAKYTDPGGQVWLTSAREDNRAIVRVRDSGIGIDPEMLPHIFELFTQAEWSLSRSQGGLGIGLTLVRRLVEMHNGTITAHSAGRNHGSEFAVLLPLLSEGVSGEE